jgi:hypothetical protein
MRHSCRYRFLPIGRFQFRRCGSPVLAVSEVVPTGIAVVVERWLFFVGAKHDVTLFHSK